MRSAPQKQPSPNIACSSPEGKGGCRRAPLTKCSVGMAKTGRSRPGKARSAVGISVFLRRICHMCGSTCFASPGFNMAIECRQIEGEIVMRLLFVSIGLLGLLATALTIHVGRVRSAKQIFLGDGGDREMLTAIRAHANFIEFVPLALILILTVMDHYG